MQKPTLIDVLIIISIIAILVSVTFTYKYKMGLIDKMQSGQKLTTWEKIVLVGR
jgi:Tfp pilus assembly protein PilE